METIRKNQEEELALYTTSSQKKDAPPVQVYSLATMELEKHLKELMVLAEESREKTDSPDKRGDVSSAAASKGTSTDSGIHFNNQSIFQAAGAMQKVEKSQNGALAQELQNELIMLQQQLQQLKIEKTFFDKFIADWDAMTKKGANYKDAYAAFQKVVADLEAQLKDDPDAEALLRLISILGGGAYNSEKDWHSHTGVGGDIWKFFHGELSDPKAFQGFLKDFMGYLTDLAAKACGGKTIFESAMTNGDAAFAAQIRKLVLTIDIITRIIKVLDSSNPKTAMFEMDTILMDIEQLQINSDVQKSQQQQEQNQKTSENLQHNLKKIEKALKKLAHHHSGLFGWIEDLFKSIGKLLENIGKAIYYGMTGNEEKAKAAAKQLETPFKTLATAFKDLFNGHFKEGFELLLTAVVLSMMFGVVGLALMGSKFGKDVNDMSKLAVDAVEALGEAIAAGVAKAAGDDKTCKDLLDKAKKLGEDMLANPALKVLGDIAMVAIIIASAISGQYWLAAIMVVLFVASETGLLNKATTAIANSIEKDMGGKNSALAKVIADIIVIAVVTILSAGAGAAEAALATGADAAAAAGEEMVDMAANTASNAAEDATEEGVEEGAETSSTEGPSRAAQIAKRAASMGAFGMGSVLGSSTLALDILEATHKKDDETLAIILELIQVVVAAITAAVGGVSTLSQSATQLGRSAEEAGAQMSQVASRTAIGGTAVQGVSGAAQGGESIIQARLNEVLQTYKGNAALDQATINNITTEINQTEQELKQLVDQYQKIIQTAFKVPAELENGEVQAMLQG